ncbi:hypothetical protein [Paenibacillus tepidiphilus]|uniref:hypothetical protein n=1 Tax=Paenibacillus tepidiphilus TaxID=2608683 RepID=UPI00123BCBEB|nr:hypothetical protein [Paenibacillus tepidiphilus]
MEELLPILAYGLPAVIIIHYVFIRGLPLWKRRNGKDSIQVYGGGFFARNNRTYHRALATMICLSVGLSFYGLYYGDGFRPIVLMGMSTPIICSAILYTTSLFYMRVKEDGVYIANEFYVWDQIDGVILTEGSYKEYLLMVTIHISSGSAGCKGYISERDTI